VLDTIQRDEFAIIDAKRGQIPTPSAPAEVGRLGCPGAIDQHCPPPATGPPPRGFLHLVQSLKTRAFAEDFPWMEGWENQQRANDASTQANLNAMSRRPNIQPDFVDTMGFQSNGYPVNFAPTPPVAQLSTTRAAIDMLSESVNSAPSPALSIPSATTSAPIPY
jgi:hypothetical protein